MQSSAIAVNYEKKSEIIGMMVMEYVRGLKINRLST